MRLVLVGPPGSGKGTQAERLVQRFGLTVIGTGAMFRDAITRDTTMGRQVRPMMDQGLLVPDPIVNDVVAELFRGPARPERFVMDGYPRTYAQAIAFDALLHLEYLSLDAVINLAIHDDEVVRRIGGRRCCSNPECGVCFHSMARPPKVAGQCDVCGHPLLQRDDDNEETIRRRLGEFHKNTDDLLTHYRKQKLVDDIAATDPPDVIFQNILAALTRRNPKTQEAL
ncbi:Adenylate kinase [Gemmata sp. SH-PL17]|uniref:adenylate kinase family protein n=1 Tax=Gemmata sp. SH-PL17 TaxID=1630693 RepID=UPI0004BAF937|nr:nucleoside monophosphate kinase [Gemmata sp. SH-PL17]AMV28944.1 Adenylate kinase [Gemmata sp. SH-PL17]